MKIGILTYHRPCNFGANLQAFASSQYLSNLGHDVKVIDYVRERDITYSGIIPDVQYNAHRKFVEDKLPLTRMAKTEEDLRQITREEKFDLVIVGADAVWSATDNYSIFFCKWLFDDQELNKNIKVASISPADMGGGYAKLSEETKRDIRACLEQFSYITVRDNWTKKAINNQIFNRRDFVKTVNPDPVSLIDELVETEKWNSHGIEQKKYVVMTLTTDWIKSHRLKKRRIKWFRSFKKEINDAGFKLVELPLPDGPSGLEFDQTIPLPFDCIQWYLTLKNAKAYCGVRYHAIVSCIAAGVPFYSLDTYCKRPRGTIFLDIIGFHVFARRFDNKSKIKNLLDGSGFQSFRTANLEFESPKNVAQKILSCSIERVMALSQIHRKLFIRNISNILHEQTL